MRLLLGASKEDLSLFLEALEELVLLGEGLVLLSDPLVDKLVGLAQLLILLQQRTLALHGTRQ